MRGLGNYRLVVVKNAKIRMAKKLASSEGAMKENDCEFK